MLFSKRGVLSTLSVGLAVLVVVAPAAIDPNAGSAFAAGRGNSAPPPRSAPSSVAKVKNPTATKNAEAVKSLLRTNPPSGSNQGPRAGGSGGRMR